MRSTLTGCGTIPSDLGRVGATARAEDEGEGAVVADLLGDLERLGEVLLGLAGEADDDVGRDRRIGHVLADQRDAVQVALAVVGAAHRLEDPARSRLQRQVDVLADGLALGVGEQHVLPHVLGVRARVADPLDAVDRVDRAQQLREAVRLVAAPLQVAAVAVDVLAEQRHLADPVGGQAPRPRRAARRAGRLCSRPRVEGTMQYEQTQLQPCEICSQAWKGRSRWAGRCPAKSSNSK